MITQIIKGFSTLIKLVEIIEEAPETYTFKFTVPENIKWTPGAYAHFLASDLNNGKKMDKDLVRELSIMSHPDEGFIGITTRIRKNSSSFKQALLNLKVNDEIRLFKQGNHIKFQRTGKPIVFISMGVGIATFRPLILDYLQDSTQIPFITNINIDRSENFVYHDELVKIADDKIKSVWVNNRADLNKTIGQTINPDTIYYVVGSDEFNKNIGDFLQTQNVAKKSINFDKH